MGLLLQLHHRVKMLVVDVSVNPEQTLQDGFGHRHEVLGKGHSCRTEGGVGGNADVKRRARAVSTSIKVVLKFIKMLHLFAKSLNLKSGFM